MKPTINNGPSDSAPFAVTDYLIAGVTGRALGPIEAWGIDITFHRNDLGDFKEALSLAVKSENFRYSGYLIENGDQITFHMSRIPRRVNITPPNITEYEANVAALKPYLEELGVPAIFTIEQPSKEKQMRAIFGLQEGYYEPKRLDLLAKIDDENTIKTLAEALTVIEKIGLDLKRFDIDTTTCTTLEELTTLLRSKSFAIEHSPVRAREILATKLSPDVFESTQIIPASIYAIGPDSNGSGVSVYQEPAISVTAPDTEESKQALVILGNMFRQARFSIEHLADKQAFNYEILDFSSNAAAS